MTTALNKVEIPVAVPASSKLDLTCDHVTTMNFGECQPVHYRHVIKGEHLNLNAIGKVRPMPMACPTYGRMRLNLHHFFVPWRVVFPQFDYMIDNNIAVNMSDSAIIEDGPFILNSDIVNTIRNGLLYSQSLTNWQTGDPYDFCMPSNTPGDHYRFTTFGKFLYKILCSLGYAINWDDKDSTPYSALPLLAYCKVYVDYYANQSYLDSSDIIELRKLFAYNDPTSPLQISAAQFAIMSVLIKNVVYDPDYYIGAWDNPFAPSTGQYSAISFNDVRTGAAVQAGVDGTPYMTQSNASVTTLGTQYLHDALKAITDYSKRHQLAGASNIQRELAQWGFGVSHLKSDRSYHLGTSSIDIQTGAVFSTANTATGNNPSTLGDFAGQGVGNGNSSFDFRPEEFGLQITIGSIMPSGGYFQGMDENNMHINRLSFFTPEFDGLAVQALRKREVYTSINGSFGRINNVLDYDTAFGMTGRYGEYKRPRSWVSGDLRCPTRLNGGDAWHLMREFSDASFPNGISDLHHGLAFTRFLDGDTYRRIFTNTNTDNDPFIVELHFDVHSFAPCRGLFETYEFDSQNSKKVTLEANGATLN